MSLKIFLLAFFAGMCSSLVISGFAYYMRPFDLTMELIATILFAGGSILTCIAFNESRKDKYRNQDVEED